MVIACGLQSISARGGGGAPPDTVPATSGVITITPIVHSSVQLEHAGTVIQVDPWSLGDLSTAKPADLILVTDDVGHHLDAKAIQQLRKPGAPIIIPPSGRTKIPDGVVLPNGEHTTAAGIAVESIPAYDIKPGEPSHPMGNANGYVVTLGGKRIYFAGVTECVPEIRALKNIDVAFVPMLLPLERMMPAAAADCVKTLKPHIVYPYHYDQGYASRLSNPRAAAGTPADAAKITAGIEAFRKALAGEHIDVRIGGFYPADAAGTVAVTPRH
jgi:L-ascorbate metabolism protein UlaG (beta-lactamase superfamily)